MAHEPLRTLPIHGFVLAGGRSARMGRDKALLPFRGRPMIEIALEKLRGFCTSVSVAGDRKDLQRFAPITCEERTDAGPGAGIEAGLAASSQPWAIFLPVDVPLVPGELLQLWATEALRVERIVSYLNLVRSQPAFCLLRCEHAATFSRLLDSGERRLEALLEAVAAADGGTPWTVDAESLYGQRNSPGQQTLASWFRNINTPQELADAEADAQAAPAQWHT